MNVITLCSDIVIAEIMTIKIFTSSNIKIMHVFSKSFMADKYNRLGLISPYTDGIKEDTSGAVVIHFSFVIKCKIQTLTYLKFLLGLMN